MNRRMVIGVGLPKTGTTSLEAALEALGYRNVAGFDMQDCDRFLHGDFEGLIARLEGCDGAQDWPWSLMYQPVYRAFPDALFVLTLREDEASWFKSMQGHAKHVRKHRRPPGMRQHVFGYEDPGDDPGHHVNFYRRHNELVRRFFRDKGSLLEVCWGKQDGWSALCGALEVEQPAGPFPHRNKRRG